VRHRNVLQTLLEKDHQGAEADTESKALHRLVAEWLQLVGRVADGQYEQEARNERPQHDHSLEL
jgi:hypothetical protein